MRYRGHERLRRPFGLVEGCYVRVVLSLVAMVRLQKTHEVLKSFD